MSEKSIKARELFLKGYNCSQSLLGAFCEDLGLDFNTAMLISSSFGGGMGGLRETCGALSGAFMVIGLKYGYVTPDNPNEKAELYKKVRMVAEAFNEKHGTMLCRELLEAKSLTVKAEPSPRTEKYYKERPCAVFVESAAEILEEIL